MCGRGGVQTLGFARQVVYKLNTIQSRACGSVKVSQSRGALFVAVSFR